MSTHPAQLLICHEHIGAKAPSAVHPTEEYQFCSLSAYAWCVDCGYYVCDIHAVSRHERHQTQPESEDPSDD